MTATLTVRGFSCSIAVPGTPLTVNWATQRQTMRGFGASDPTFDDTDLPPDNGLMPDAVADLLFSTTTGAGLSLLCNGIDPNGAIWSNPLNSTKAAARGAKIWARPWSPPAAWKDNGSVTNGGHLLTGNYNDWANVLAGFQATLQAQSGVDLYGVCIQNEPDFSAFYASCLYTNTETVNFIKVLGPKLAALSPRPLLIAGTYSNADNVYPMAAAIEADATALSYCDVYASNQYFGTMMPISGGLRPFWESEWSSFDGYDPSIGNAINMAKKLHTAVVDANCAIWQYWWTYPLADNEGLFGPGYAVPKRLWTMGQWSRYVRPGYVRVTTGSSPSNTYVSAFREVSTGNFAIVCINDTGSPVTLAVTLSGATPGPVSVTRTSSTEDIATLSTIVPAGSTIPVTLAANSITSFTGTAT